MPDRTATLDRTGSAHVGSSDAIVDLRAALHTFIDEVTSALESVQLKAGKALRWLDEDVPAYWRRQEQEAFDAVNAARTALTICKTQTVAGRRKSCIEEKQALRRSKERQELCGVQRSRSRGAAIDTHSAADDYRARITALHRFIEAELPKLLAMLHRTSVALDAYSATRPPSPKLSEPADPEPAEEASP